MQGNKSIKDITMQIMDNLENTINKQVDEFLEHEQEINEKDEEIIENKKQE